MATSHPMKRDRQADRQRDRQTDRQKTIHEQYPHSL